MPASARGLLHEHAEFSTQHRRISLGQVHRRLDTQAFQVQFHFPPNAPDLCDISITQHPISFVWRADIQ